MSTSNNQALPPKPISPSTPGYYNYASSDPAHWRPWGLHDYKFIPSPLKEAFENALDQLGIHKDKDRDTLHKRLEGIAIGYWENRRSVERPPLKWYRDNIQPIRAAVCELLQLVATRRGLSGLNRLMQIEINRPLMKGTGRPQTFESIEELLEQVVRVCDKMLRQRATGGRRKDLPVVEAARQAAKLWREVKQKRVGVSLNIITDAHWKFGPSQQVFSYPGPLFVQTVLQGADDKLSVQRLRTVLRDVLSPKRKA